MNTTTTTNPKEILEAISKLTSIYSVGAKMHINDEVTGTLFLKEIYEDFKEQPEQFVEHFGYKTTFKIYEMFKES